MGSISPSENPTAYTQSGEFTESNYSDAHDHYDGHQAIYDYARIMHEHTKKQLSTATSSARRRSQAVDLQHETSSVSSVSSTGS